MLIDWFTVCAQLVNFLILVWLLKIFLYKPVLQSIQARQNEIDKVLLDAQEKKQEAEQEYATYKEKNRYLAAIREEKLQKAAQEIEEDKQLKLKEARSEIERLKASWHESLQAEKQDVYRAIALRVQKEIFAIAQKAIQDLSSHDLTLYIVETLLKRLTNVPHGPVVVKTAVELGSADRAMLQKALGKDVTFQTAPDLITGIELLFDGQKIGWNVSEYLSSLESEMQEHVL